MTRTPRVVLGFVASAALAIGLSACGGSDVSKDKFTSELQDKASLTEDQATCVTDKIYDELDQGEINDLYEADDESELSGDAGEVFSTAVTDCVSADLGVDTTDTTEAEG